MGKEICWKCSGQCGEKDWDSGGIYRPCTECDGKGYIETDKEDYKDNEKVENKGG